MAKRITDFFGVSSKKLKSSNPESYILPQNLPAETSNSNTSYTINQVEPVEGIIDCPPSSSSSLFSTIEPVEVVPHISNSNSVNSEWYKGSKLDADWLIQTFEFLKKVKLGKRSGIQCILCFNHISQAKKLSRNGQVPIADGVRCDGKKELMRIIDHLNSDAHNAACCAEKTQVLWMSQSDKHPWLKLLKSHESEVVTNLIELAIDVHNDSRIMTLSANSWPSRSLSKIHSDAQISTYREHGLDSDFVSFNPSGAVLHYKDPNIYREMLDIIAEIVMESVSEELKKSICFSIQIDGSVDKYSVDNKFITARYLDETNAIKNVFLGESHSSKRGAEGLLDCILSTLKNLGLEDMAKEKLTGLTTDGESANTGKKSGLWVRLREYLKRDILCIWCVTHRCDLAFSDIESMVTEVKHWKINLKSVATFYRGSAIRTDELKAISEKEKVKFYRFPQYFEVRFVEHLILLCESVWKNMPSIRKHWNNIVTADTDTSNRKEKAMVTGFLKVWQEDGDQIFYTALMMDLLRLFERFQKDGQKSMVTLCDIETSKNIAISSLELMETDYYPGGKEEELNKFLDDKISDNSDEINNGNISSKNHRKVRNVYVSTKRCVTSVRTEIVKSAKEFLSNRLADDQSSIIQRFTTFLSARSPQDTIKAIRCDIEGIFGNENVTTFCDEVIGLYATDKLPCPINITDPTGKLYYYLKISSSTKFFAKVVQAYATITPHSCGPERAVSCHTILKTNKQSCYSRDAINSRMYIALNSTGTANFDPRPAVATFLRKKERRYNLPDQETYKNRSFIKKFFEK